MGKSKYPAIVGYLINVALLIGGFIVIKIMMCMYSYYYGWISKYIGKFKKVVISLKIPLF